MRRKIRIGNAGGYWGEDPDALRRQLVGGKLDYVTLDFLAEITMSILQKQRARDPELGYAADFVDQMRECLPIMARTGTRVITNAGGINPLGLGRRLRDLARELGLDVTVGVVRGDDIVDRLEELAAAGEPLANMETGEPLAPVRDRVAAANIYFGAAPVVKALAAGAQIVVTGRVTDTGITLAPMIHEFGWAVDDWDRLASGIVAGHILECGAQGSGGNLTDWQEVPDFHEIGYPIVEMERGGDFTVTKHPRTGGLVNEKTVKEQLVYEMGDPGCYISPDVVARFDSIAVRREGPDRVRVSGVRGLPRPEMLKVSLAYDDGWKAAGDILVCGPDVHAKCEVLADILWTRLGESYEETHTAIIGGGAVWPDRLVGCGPSEVLLHCAVRDADREKVRRFGMLLPTVILSGPSGLAVQGGRPKPSPVVAYWPALLRRDRVAPEIVVLDAAGGERRETCPDDMTGTAPLPSATRRRPAAPAVRVPGGRLKEMKLRELAYGRSGDKGDTCNIGVLARSPEIHAWLCGYLTAARVKRFFPGIVLGKVTRHRLDNLHGLNFLLEETLGGGGTVSLLVDPQGKTLAQALLEMTVRAPAALLKTRPRGA